MNYYLRLHVEHLQKTHNRCFFYVWFEIRQKLSDDRQHIVDIVSWFKRAKISQCKAPNLGRSMLAIFLESVDCHYGKVRIIFCIGCQIEVDHLLHDFVVSERGSAHFWEDWRCVHAKRHIANYLFDDFATLFAIIVIDDPVESTTSQKIYFFSSFISPFFFSSKYCDGLEDPPVGFILILIWLQIYYLYTNIAN